MKIDTRTYGHGSCNHARVTHRMRKKSRRSLWKSIEYHLLSARLIEERKCCRMGGHRGESLFNKDRCLRVYRTKHPSNCTTCDENIYEKKTTAENDHYIISYTMARARV